jgi:hypothetical protein
MTRWPLSTQAKLADLRTTSAISSESMSPTQKSPYPYLWPGGLRFHVHMWQFEFSLRQRREVR